MRSKLYSVTLTLLFIFGSQYCAAQEQAKTAAAEVYLLVEEMPVYENEAKKNQIYNYLNEHIQYPDAALEQKIEGRIFANFTVQATGELTDIKILKGIGAGCDEELVRVLKDMPNWTPGMQKGEVVAVQFNLPYNFVLPDRIFTVKELEDRETARLESQRQQKVDYKSFAKENKQAKKMEKQSAKQ